MLVSDVRHVYVIFMKRQMLTANVKSHESHVNIFYFPLCFY